MAGSDQDWWNNQKVPDLSPLKGWSNLQTLLCSVMSEKVTGFQDLLGLKSLARIVTHRDIMKKADRDAFKKQHPKVELAIR